MVLLLRLIRVQSQFFDWTVCNLNMVEGRTFRTSCNPCFAHFLDSNARSATCGSNIALSFVRFFAAPHPVPSFFPLECVPPPHDGDLPLLHNFALLPCGRAITRGSQSDGHPSSFFQDHRSHFNHLVQRSCRQSDMPPVSPPFVPLSPT